MGTLQQRPSPHQQAEANLPDRGIVQPLDPKPVRIRQAQRKAATSPEVLAEVLISEPVVDEIRKELRRRTGHNASAIELARLLRETVLRPECLA
jgi:hypothetical protein